MAKPCDGFDFSAALNEHVKKHKNKPAQFGSVAAGVQNRLEKNIQYRKSTRITVFDSARDIPECDTPIQKKITKETDAQIKAEHRRQQLEKWKEEKEKKKKEMAAQKKQPFVTGVAKKPIAVSLPPSRTKPSTSGRVTRSQSSKHADEKKSANKVQSFAPKNAQFKAPQLKNSIKLPTLVPIGAKAKNTKIIFNPIVPINLPVKVTRSQTARSYNPKLTHVIHHSSSSDSEPLKENIPSKQRKTSRKSLVLEQKSKSKSSETSFTSESSVERKPTTNKATLDKKNNKTEQKYLKMSLTSESSVEILAKIKDKTHVRQRKTPKQLLTRQNAFERVPVEEKITKSTPRKSITKDTKMTPKNKTIPKSESNSEEKLRSPKNTETVVLTPEQIQEEVKNMSPFVTLSRGKDRARKEIKQKMAEGLFEEDESNLESVTYFRRQLNSEIQRLTKLCESWEATMEEAAEQGLPLPDTVQELVLGALGQARLLMRSKLQQFGSLVARCEQPETGATLVTPADLHGFWDMVFMQIENVDMRFKRLEELKSRNWQEEVEVQKKKPVKSNIVASKKPAKPAGGPSRLREMIAAARKAKKEATTCQSPAPVTEKSEEKTFEAGFFSITSPVKSPILGTPDRSKLLKSVLSSEAKKAACKSASRAMLRASLMSKNVDYTDIEGVAPLPFTPKPAPVNLQATPARSILKSANVESTKKSAKKSIKTVLFNESDTDLENTVQNNKEDRKTRSLHKLDAEIKELLEDSGILEEVERSPIMTRSRRRSMTPKTGTPKKTPLKQKKQVLQELETNLLIEDITPRRSSRRKKSEV